MTTDDKLIKTAADEMELESATKRYLAGETSLIEYKREVAGIETRLDLRKVVSQLKPILASLFPEKLK
jgi:hypothetical protein